jgi:hypothetical protein
MARHTTGCARAMLGHGGVGRRQYATVFRRSHRLQNPHPTRHTSGNQTRTGKYRARRVAYLVVLVVCVGAWKGPRFRGGPSGLVCVGLFGAHWHDEDLGGAVV